MSSSLRPSFLRPLFVRLSFILASVCIQYIYVYSAWISRWLYNIYRDLVHVPAEFFKDSKRSWLPFLSITTRHQRKGQGKVLELKEVKRKKKQEQTSNKKEERERNRPTRKEQKKDGKKKEKKRKKIVSRALIHITSISLCHLILVR